MKTSMPSAKVVGILEYHDLYSEDLKSKLEYCWPNPLALKRFKEPSKLIHEKNKTKFDVLFLDSEYLHRFSTAFIQRIAESNCQTILTYRETKPTLQELSPFQSAKFIAKPILISKLKELYQQLKKQWQEIMDFLPSGRIFLNSQSGIRFVKPQEIILCKALDNYTTFHLLNNEKRIISKSLKKVEQQLQSYDFFRSHQSYLVNLNFVRELIRADGGKLVLAEGLHAYLAKSKKESLLERLRQLAA